MGTAALTIVDSRYSTNVTGSWKGTSETQIWSGIPSDYAYSYFSYIEIAIGNITMVHSDQIALKLQLDQLSYLGGVLGVLTASKLDSTKIQNSALTGMSETLSNAAIATSKACSASGAEYAYDNTSYASGNYFYLFFDTDDLSANTTYYVYLLPTAKTQCWLSTDRSKVEAELTYTNHTACSAPTAFTATPNPFEGTVTLNWSGAKAGTSNAINGYQIQYRDSSNGSSWGNWTTLKTVSATATSGSTTDTPGIERGSYRQYRIQTRGAAGSSYYSGYSTATPSVRKNRLPVVPTSLTVSSTLIASGTEVTVTWPTGSDNDSNLSGYVLDRSSDGGSTYTQVYSGANTSYKEKLTGSAGQQFKYRVRSKDSLGALSSSYRYSSIITINSAPSAPTSAHLDKQEYSPGDKITLSWSGASDADNNIAEYIVGFRYNESDAWTTHGRVSSASGSGSYEFRPQSTEYLQRIYMGIRTVDSLGATSAWKSAGSVLRNDNPYAYIRSDDGGAYVADTDKHLVCVAEVAGDPSSFSRYMPYIFDGESWQRCIE